MTAMTKNQTTPDKGPLFFKLALISILISIGIHLYLTSLHYSFLGHSIGKSVCDVSETFNCTAVAASQYSKFLGMPIALWGAAANFVLLLMLLNYKVFRPENGFATYTGWMALSLLVASVIMGSISVTMMSSYCLFCLILYVFSLLTFISATRYLQTPLFKDFGTNLTLLFSKRWGTLAFFIAIPALAWLADGIVMQNLSKQAGVRDMDHFVKSKIQEWQNNSPFQVAADLGIHFPSKIPAKVKIVEFADFMCSHCQAAAPVLEAFLNSHPDVELQFLLFPLDGECNDDIPRKWGVSCSYAKGAHCANKQNKGKEAHQWIFEHAPGTAAVEDAKAKLKTMTADLKLDETSFNACYNAPETHESVKQVAKEGARGQIGGTPAIFVQGRQLPGAQLLPVLQEAYFQSVK